MLEQVSWDKTARTGQLGKTVVIVQPRQESDYRIARTDTKVRTRVFSEFRGYGIPYVLFNSVYSVYYTELPKIPRNYAEFRFTEFVKFCGISRLLL
jgi:hypothetical protein